MTVTENQINLDIELSLKQTIAFDLLNPVDAKGNEVEKAVEVLYGGAKFGGKSHFGCVWSFQESHRLINKYGLEPSDHAVPVGFMGRKVGRDFTDTTLERWKQIIPADLYEIKGMPAQIIIDNTVKIMTGGFDKAEVVNKFNSAEFAFYFIDQAEELEQAEILLLRAATFWRLLLNGRKVPGKGLLTANPRQCWLKEEFIDVHH